MIPSVPNGHALAMLLATVLALYLFTRDRYPLEFTSIGIIAALAVGFSIIPFPGVDPVHFFYGFAHEALIAVCALMVLGQGLVKTGSLEPVGRALAGLWGKAPFITFLATLLVGAVLSAFVNNTPIVVLLLPILISVCLRTSSSPAGVLMPMGFATLVGGMATTIGTSTNLLVVSIAKELGLPEFGMFDFVVPASIAGLVAIAYLWLIAPRLLPDRPIDLEDSSPRVFDARLELLDDTPVIGRSLADAIAMTGGDMRVVRIRRKGTVVMPLPDVKLQPGDRLRVRDTPTRLKTFEDALKGRLYSGERPVDEEHPLSAEDQMLAEIAVVQGSGLDRTNLRFAQFISRYQLAVVALHRAGTDIWRPREEIQDVILEHGDILLVQGSREQLAALKRSNEFLVLDATVELPRTSKAPLALAIIAGAVTTAALGIMPIAISALAGAALLIFTRCLDLEAALKAISPNVYFVVVASLALGYGLIETGATQYMTDVFLAATSDLPPAGIVSALMLLLALLTNVVSNNAAAVIGTPIAVGIAAQLSLPPEPFVLGVLFGANMSFATPMAYKTNLLVMSAGNYRFGEFVKVGVPLTILVWITLSWVLGTMYF